MTTGNNFINDCRLILILARETIQFTMSEMARLVGMSLYNYMRAEKDGKGLKTSHIIKAADKAGIKITLKLTHKDLEPLDIKLN